VKRTVDVPKVAEVFEHAHLYIYRVYLEAGGEANWLKLSAEEKERKRIAVVVGKVTVKDWLEKNKSLLE
jgi:hypothetical protein